MTQLVPPHHRVGGFVTRHPFYIRSKNQLGMRSSILLKNMAICLWKAKPTLTKEQLIRPYLDIKSLLCSSFTFRIAYEAILKILSCGSGIPPHKPIPIGQLSNLARHVTSKRMSAWGPVCSGRQSMHACAWECLIRMRTFYYLDLFISIRQLHCMRWFTKGHCERFLFLSATVKAETDTT